MQGTGERAGVVRLRGPAITAGLEGLPRTQGAGERAGVLCGRAITSTSATSIGWATTGLADEGRRRAPHRGTSKWSTSRPRAWKARRGRKALVTAGLEGPPLTQGADERVDFVDIVWRLGLARLAGCWLHVAFAIWAFAPPPLSD